MYGNGMENRTVGINNRFFSNILSSVYNGKVPHRVGGGVTVSI